MTVPADPTARRAAPPVPGPFADLWAALKTARTRPKPNLFQRLKARFARPAPLTAAQLTALLEDAVEDRELAGPDADQAERPNLRPGEADEKRDVA